MRSKVYNLPGSLSIRTTRKTNVPKKGPALESQIGQFLHNVRVKNNFTQLEAVRLSGLHRNTVSKIKGGAGATLSTLVQLLRTYKYLHLIEPMKPLPIEISPIQLWKLQQKRRRNVKHRVKS
ncbi:MAG: hypothetical protein ING84_08645 [Cytophagales bacterium]|nr:hypothetical protein [Cytophagales bacterium]MCA6367410.1 hypothetical protein [Cytophagales bacterium]MCA6373712.1 hypothetical protein [Cytophagales bacterium]MCA6377234.1 hypothetical protein [Cytophagales bacterium]